MDLEKALLPAVFIIASTSTLLVIVENWRLKILLLSIQYIGVFLLVLPNWPLVMAVTKIVAGWIAGAILGLALIGLPETENRYKSTNSTQSRQSINMIRLRMFASTHSFKFLAALLFIPFVLSVAPDFSNWIPDAKIEQIMGSLILLGLGILQLGLSTQTPKVILGLLTLLSGFEILYSTVEISTLVAGLLSAITMGIALIGAYLLISDQLEEN